MLSIQQAVHETIDTILQKVLENLEVVLNLISPDVWEPVLMTVNAIPYVCDQNELHLITKSIVFYYSAASHVFQGHQKSPQKCYTAYRHSQQGKHMCIVHAVLKYVVLAKY